MTWLDDLKGKLIRLRGQELPHRRILNFGDGFNAVDDPIEQVTTVTAEASLPFSKDGVPLGTLSALDIGGGISASLVDNTLTLEVDDVVFPALPIVSDEGTPVTGLGSINFVGDGVTASGTGDAVTVTIPGGGGGASAYTAIVSSKAELAAVPGVTLVSRVLTIPADTSILINGTVDMRDTAGIAGSSTNDTIKLSSGCVIAGHGQLGQSRILFDNYFGTYACIESPTNLGIGIQIRGVRLWDASYQQLIKILATSATVGTEDTGSGWVIEDCFIAPRGSGNASIYVTSTIPGIIQNCVQHGGTTFVEYAHGAISSNTPNLIRNCRAKYSGGNVSTYVKISTSGAQVGYLIENCVTDGRLLWVNSSSTFDNITVRNCQTRAPAAAAVDLGSTAIISQFVFCGNRIKASPSYFGITIATAANLKAAIITDNIFESPRANCFNNINSDTPKSGTQAQFRSFRNNLSIDGTAIYALLDTPIQTNAPTTLDA